MSLDFNPMFGPKSKITDSQVTQGSIYFTNDSQEVFLKMDEGNAKKVTVGAARANGNEVFNDYENNVATGVNSAAFGQNTFSGAKGCLITNKPATVARTGASFTAQPIEMPTEWHIAAIPDLESLTQGETVSLTLEANYNRCATLQKIEINHETNTAVVTIQYTNSATSGAYFHNGKAIYTDADWKIITSNGNYRAWYLRFPNYPEIGDSNYSTGALAFGWNAAAEAIGAIAGGYGTLAEGKYSAAFGNSNYAGHAAITSGVDNYAMGDQSAVFGRENIARGQQSLTIGKGNQALGDNSFAGGNKAIAAGTNSISFGEATQASGAHSVVFGRNNESTGNYTLVAGDKNTITKLRCYAFGLSNNIKDNADCSCAIGSGNTITSARAFAFGDNLINSVDFKTVIGKNNVDDPNNIFEIGNGGNANNRLNIFAVSKSGEVTAGGKKLINEDYFHGIRFAGYQRIEGDGVGTVYSVTCPPGIYLVEFSSDHGAGYNIDGCFAVLSATSSRGHSIRFGEKVFIISVEINDNEATISTADDITLRII